MSDPAYVHILVEIRGGRLDDIHCDVPFKFVVIDYDALEEGEDHETKPAIQHTHAFKGNLLSAMNTTITDANERVTCAECGECLVDCDCDSDDDDDEDDDEDEVAEQDTQDAEAQEAADEGCPTCGRAVPLHWRECPSHPGNAGKGA